MSEQQFDEDELVNAVYESFKHEHPTSDTDREIMTNSLDMKSAKSSSPFAGNWKVPLSLAAVLVVGLAVVLRLGISPDKHEPGADEFRMKQSAPASVREKKAVPAMESQALPRAATDKDIESIEKVIEAESKEIEELIEKDMADVKEDDGSAAKSYGSINDFMSAEFWAEEIRSLYARGMEDQARRELIVFKEAFPDYDAEELDRLFDY